MPVQVLKIDPSFIRNMLDDAEDYPIVQCVLGLAQAFAHRAAAEGAKTSDHCELLPEIGCELAQGYDIARPMPASDMPAWVKRWQPEF